MENKTFLENIFETKISKNFFNQNLLGLALKSLSIGVAMSQTVRDLFGKKFDRLGSKN